MTVRVPPCNASWSHSRNHDTIAREWPRADGRLAAVGSGDQAAPAYFRRSTKVNWPVAGAIGGAGFQAASKYR